MFVMLFRTVVLAVFFSFTALLPAQDDKSHEVAPGVTLPSTGTIYGLDSAGKGPALVQLHATEVVLNTHAANNFARGMVYAGPHSSVEITGVSSAATLHTPQAVFYVRLTGDDPELLRNRVQIVRLNPAKDRRVVLVFTMNVFGGHRARHYEEVPAAKSDITEAVWVKLTPQTPLEPGEYAVAFVNKDVNSFADQVYDFSILEAVQKLREAPSKGYASG